MNEERPNAYLQLINQLLAGNSGEEIEILNAHPDLLDDGLVTAMLQEAAKLTGQGKLDEANRLMNLAGTRLRVTALKAKADRLYKEGHQQYQSSQFQAALQSWQESLKIDEEIGNQWRIADSLNGVGLAYYSLGQYQEAMKCHQQSLEIKQKIGDLLGQAQSLTNLGNIDNSLGKYQQAINYHQQTLNIAQKIPDALSQGNALNNLGYVYINLGNYQKAIEYCEQSLKVAEKITHSSLKGTALGNLGNAYHSLGKHEQAIDCYEQSLEIFQKNQDPQGEERILGNFGGICIDLGKYEKALEYYQENFKIAQAIQNPKDEALALGNLGNVYINQGNYQKALACYKRSLKIALKIKVSQIESAARRCLGIIFSNLGDYQKALNYYQHSLEIAERIKDLQLQGNILNNMGNDYTNLGSYQQAIDCHKQSLEIAQKTKYSKLESNALGNLGNAYSSLGEYKQALKFQEQGLASAQKIKVPQEIAIVLGNLGITYNRIGNYQKAIECYLKGLAIAQEIKDLQTQAYALRNLGMIYNSLREYEKAKQYSQQSLEIAKKIQEPKIKANILGNLGHIHSNLGDHNKAIELHHKSLVIAKNIEDERTQAIALMALGDNYIDLGEDEKGCEFYQQSLKITRRIKDRQNEGSTLNNLGLAQLKIGKFVEAEKTLRDCVEVWESIRVGLGSDDAHKVSIFEGQARSYRTLQEVLIAQNQTDAALEIAERGRARAFVELLAQRLSSQFDQVPILSLNLQEIQDIAKKQNATLVEYSIITDDSRYQSELFIWVIKQNGEIAFKQVDLKPLKQKNTSLSDLVSQVRKSLGVEEELHSATPTTTQEIPQSIKHITKPLRKLHQYLIEPIANLLPTDPDAHVIFIPQGKLFLVPFPALEDATGKFLIQQHTILTAPSIQTLGLTRQQQQSVGTINESPLRGEDVLVVGNPTMPTIPLKEPLKPLEQLPSSEKEAIAIASLFYTEPFIGEDAIKVDIEKLMPEVRLIHLATHGLLDDIKQLGIPGAIALAPSEDDNGFLTAGEILKMKLNAKLVVLSACSSGQGRITGDGVIGLSRSLFAAGVPSVIVSLWKVGDCSTEFLMTEFYQNLRQGMNKAKALCQAMLTTMEDFSGDPSNWAAFTLIGEAD
ncbi:MAG: tetratricopeptide repeat protein [Symploca sp. SIO3E6]|nr:tetratricopeptide repeat protein [Caldora sp. SIO3E6]